MQLKLIVSTLMLITCLHLLAENPSNDKTTQLKEQNKHRLDLFRTNSGFKGAITPINDNRIFFKLEGSFPLPVPVDTVVFRSNCQKISNYINSFYQIGASPSEPEDSVNWSLQTSHRVASFNKLYALTYDQYFNDFSLSPKKFPFGVALLDFNEMDCKLRIYYHIKDKKYFIVNGLFPEVIPLERPRVSKQQALDIISTEFCNPEYLQKRGLSISQSQQPLQPEYRGHYLSIYPIKDSVTHTFNYSYLIFLTFENDFSYYTVDGLTGEIEEVPKIN